MNAVRRQLARSRRGVVLLVVLALLTLFAVVAVTFVFFSEQEAVSAQLHKESEIRFRPDPDLPFVYFLSQLVFGTENRNSTLRMQDLLTNMYGPPDSNTPFNGLGRRVATHSTFPNIRLDRAINIGRLYGNPGFTEAELGSFNPPYTYPDHNFPALGAVGDPIQNGNTIVLERSFVRDVVLFDRNGNPFVFNPYDPQDPDYANFWNGLPLVYHNANPSPAERRLLVARPIADSNEPGFGPPTDPGGDVRNLPPGWRIMIESGDPNNPTPVPLNGNDSYWFDFGFPVQVGPDGKWYKPLAAIFLMDLHGMLNVNVHGNILAAGNSHASNQGFGPWEVNLGHLLPLPNGGEPESARLLLGSLNPPLPGRYGAPYTSAGTQPGPVGGGYRRIPGIRSPHYAGLDLDATMSGVLGRVPSSPPVYPKVNVSGIQLHRYPLFASQLGYETTGVSLYDEYGPQHPGHFQPYRPRGDDRLFQAHELEALLRHGDTGTDALHSELRQLVDRNLALAVDPNTMTPGPAVKARRLLTTHSNDIVRVGAGPWYYATDGNDQFRYLLPGNQENVNNLFPRGQRGTNPADSSIPTPGAPPPGLPSDFLNGTWRANLMDKPKLDVNRPLPDYPADTNGNGRIDDETNWQLVFQEAQRARQDLARDIFTYLRWATGAIVPPPPPPSLETNAQRWLAQLAVNIVDAIDSDDYSTPFSWASAANVPVANPDQGIVYGFELPRLVINEVYGEFVQTDPVLQPNNYRCYLWAELYNPLQTDNNLRDGGRARLAVDAAGARPAFSPYRLVVLTKAGGDKLPEYQWTRSDPGGDRHNWRSNPPSPCEVTFESIFAQDPPLAHIVSPSDTHYHGIVAGQQKMVTDPDTNQQELRIVPDFSQAARFGWYMVGPRLVNPEDENSGIKRFPVSRDLLGNELEPDPDRPEPLYRDDRLSYVFVAPNANVNPNDAQHRPTLLMQRLAIPTLPHNNDPTNPLYNPYITVDYVTDIPMYDTTVRPGQPFNAETTSSIGKRQPYASGTYVEQKPGTFPTQNRRNQPAHTFYRHNAVEELYYDEALAAGTPLRFGDGTNPPNNTVDPSRVDPQRGPQTLKLPFDWLVHFDRPLINVTELMLISGLRPASVLRHFVVSLNGQEQPHAHLAAWSDPVSRNASRLYRALEFLDTRSWVGGTSTYAVRGATPIVPNGQYQWLPLQPLPGEPPIEAGVLANPLNPNQPPRPILWGKAENGGLWVIYPGATLVVDPGQPNQETIRVFAVDIANRRIQAVFARPHAAGAEVVVPFHSGRVPGKININAVHDYEVFRALLDPQFGNRFYERIVSDMFNEMVQLRNKRPFRSLATGEVPNGDYQEEAGAGVEDTLLRSSIDGAGLLFANRDPSAAPDPWTALEPLRKMYNNVTVRSNCFALWLTIGYFEVVRNPADGKLYYQEIGRQDGREIRHRYFAIIDRSVFEDWMLEATMRWAISGTLDPNTPMPNVGTIRQAAETLGLDPRRDNVIPVTIRPGQNQPPVNVPIRLPAPVVYWSRIQ
jgi:hypothetical protein